MKKSDKNDNYDDKVLTIKDIAEIAGISYSTVSRCLNNSDLVSDKTKEKVKKIAEEIGFEFNANARGLATRKTGTVGIILPKNYDKFSIHLYHSSLINYLRSIFESENYDMLIGFKENHFSGENNVKKIVTSKKVDGIIVVDDMFDEDTLDFLLKKNIPFVFSHYPPKFGIDKIHAIFSDNFLGGQMVADYLLKIGKEKFIFVTDDFTEEFRLRENGFRFSLKKHNVPGKKAIVGILRGDHSFFSGYSLAMNNIEMIKSADAVFAFNDLMAMGFMKALQEVGIRVPEDIVLFGFDDIELCKYITPALSTVHQSGDKIAELTCQRMMALINGSDIPPQERFIGIKPVLIIRESCR